MSSTLLLLVAAVSTTVSSPLNALSYTPKGNLLTRFDDRSHDMCPGQHTVCCTGVVTDVHIIIDKKGCRPINAQADCQIDEESPLSGPAIYCCDDVDRGTRGGYLNCEVYWPQGEPKSFPENECPSMIKGHRRRQDNEEVAAACAKKIGSLSPDTEGDSSAALNPTTPLDTIDPNRGYTVALNQNTNFDQSDPNLGAGQGPVIDRTQGTGQDQVTQIQGTD